MRLPDLALADLERSRSLPTAARAAALDALLVLALPDDVAFLQRLPEPQRWQIVTYVKSLAASPAPASGTY